MTNPTNPFNWQMPTASDLVTDLPADFEVFGQAVATSMADLLGGTTGQVLSKASNTDMDFTWVAQDDSNAIQNAIVDAKGDLIGATAADTPARLAVGTNGQVLTADSTAATGLAWATPSGGTNLFYAGKNKIINGDFRINQRTFTSTTTSSAYGFDRWLSNMVDGTTTYSAQTFTPGAAPVAGYEGTNFARLVTTGQTLSTAQSTLSQKIEDSRTFANQTISVSFWAKANSGTPKIATELVQNFGSGGSASVTTYAGQSTLSTSWARYSVSVAVPTISGKTVGTSSFLGLNLWVSAGTDFNSRTGSLGIQTNTFDIWGVQVEAGSTATDFQTATGTLQGELAACQRYYYRLYGGAGLSMFGPAMAYNTTSAYGYVTFPVQMRTRPLALETSGTAADYATFNSNTATTPCTAVPTYQRSNVLTGQFTTASGNLVQGNATFFADNNTTAAYLGWSAEL